jgi:hypothetical protein
LSEDARNHDGEQAQENSQRHCGLSPKATASAVTISIAAVSGAVIFSTAMRFERPLSEPRRGALPPPPCD